MAQEYRASLTYLGWTSRMSSSQAIVSKRQFEDRLKVQAHCHRPGRLGPQPLLGMNNGGTFAI